MGYGCIICDECLEVPAPEYEPPEVKNERPAEAAGSEAAAAAGPPQPTRRLRKSPSPKKKGAKNIRDGVPTDVIVTPCGHIFHQQCIARWFKDKNSMNCPACRKLCQQSRLIRIFPAVVAYHPALNDSLDSMPLTKVQPAPARPIGAEPVQSTAAGPAGAVSVFPNMQDIFQAFARRPQNANDDSGSSVDDDDQGIQFVGGTNNGMPVPPPPPPQQPQAQEARCTRPECEDTVFLHQTLMQDFEDIQTKYAAALEDLALNQATEQSYDEMLKTQAATILTLQGERDNFNEKLKERVSINQQCIQLGLKQSNQIAAVNRELDEANDTIPRTRQGGQKRPIVSKVSPPKRLRSAGNDDNPTAGGSGNAVA